MSDGDSRLGTRKYRGSDGISEGGSSPISDSLHVMSDHGSCLTRENMTGWSTNSSFH